MNNHVKSEMLSNRHTHTHTDTQTKYCNPRCACAPRVNKNIRRAHEGHAGGGRETIIQFVVA